MKKIKINSSIWFEQIDIKACCVLFSNMHIFEKREYEVPQIPTYVHSLIFLQIGIAKTVYVWLALSRVDGVLLQKMCTIFLGCYLV